jgi:amino-acid N-acetyltransferase
VVERIRRATAADQPVIGRTVRQARLNPRNLHWPAFVIAEADDKPVGVAQVRRHADGSRELASLVVVDEHRGVAARMIDALLCDETHPVFTLLDRRYAEHFTRWGFSPCRPRSFPSH